MLTKTDYPDLIPQLLQIAEQAATAILEVYNSDDFGVETKSDDSPLTRADKAAHDVICAGLAKLSPNTPILSEEAANIPFDERQQWQQYWLIDPLDGTKEFIKRNDEFTVNIALIKHGFPVIGVVLVPVSGVVYYAAEGMGAYKRSNKTSDAVKISVRPWQHDNLIVAGSRSHGSQALEDFMSCLGKNIKRISIGSSLKMCLVAEGKADIYPRLGLTSEWDTGAAQCVVEQAGGSLTNLAQERLPYNTKDSLLNPYFLTFSQTHEDWLSCLAAYQQAKP